MKIAILWTGLSGYLNSCLLELEAGGADLFVAFSVKDANAPYDDAQFAWLRNSLRWQTPADLDALPGAMEAFQPEVIVFAGWAVPQYRKLAKNWRGKALRVMTMDNPWRGTAKQLLGVVVSPVYLRPLAEMAWVPGERQACFARKLGFSQPDILRGLYCCEPRVYAEAAERADVRQPSFLFVGRLVADKGVDSLVRAYALYRTQSRAPWALHVYGIGPMEAEVQNGDGITAHGFLQPGELAGVFAQSTCFVLPSRVENWGVVMHEAASAGMILLASEAVGAVPHLVQPHFNGYILPVNDPESLATAMLKIESLPVEERRRMGQASTLLAQQFSPRAWASTLLDAARSRAVSAVPGKK